VNNRCALALLLALLLAVSGVGHAQEVEEEFVEEECDPRAQPYLDHGYFLLHCFEYEWARRELMTASAIDPECALAHAGEALSFNYTLWEPAPTEDLELGWLAMQRAQKAKKGSGRDRRFVDAVELLFQKYDVTSGSSRAIAFHNAMQRLFLVYRGDVEFAAYYGLSLLGLNGQNVTIDTTRELEAAKALERYFDGYPEHAGISHYLIRCFEPTTELAPRGLAAAQNLARIAPGVPVAQHAPARIYSRLGMWNEMMAATLAADEASVELLSSLDMEPDRRDLRNAEWKMYAYIQLGRMKEAKAFLEEIGKIAIELEYESAISTYVSMRYRFLTDGRQWAEALDAEPVTETQEEEIMLKDARLMAGVFLGDEDLIRSASRKLRVYGVGVPQRFNADAARALADNDMSGLFRALRRRTTVEDERGGRDPMPMPPIPAHELLGEMLLRIGEPARAVAEFEVTLGERPNRPATLLGLARAASELGNHEEARARLRELWSVLDGADDDFPLMVESLRLPEAQSEE